MVTCVLALFPADYREEMVDSDSWKNRESSELPFTIYSWTASQAPVSYYLSKSTFIFMNRFHPHYLYMYFIHVLCLFGPCCCCLIFYWNIGLLLVIFLLCCT